MESKVGNSARKLVLIKLADNANDDGYCFPSYVNIATHCEMSRRSVINHIKKLEDDGFLEKDARFTKTGNTSNSYKLTFSGSAKSAPTLVQNLHSPSAKSAPPLVQNLHPEPVIINQSFNLKDKDLSFSNEIFTYWKKVMEKGEHTKLTPKREKNINARLKDGYTVENIKSAIDGCINSAFHMGANNDRKKFNDIELICRSGEKIESFMELKNLSNAANSDSGLSKNNEVNYAAHQNNNQDRRTRNQIIADRITQDYMESCGSDFLENERPLRNGMDEPVSNRDVIEPSKEGVG